MNQAEEVGRRQHEQPQLQEGVEDQLQLDHTQVSMTNSRNGYDIPDLEGNVSIEGIGEPTPTPIGEAEKFGGFSDSQTIASVEVEADAA